MSDKIPVSRKAGRGFWKAVRGLLGKSGLRKAGDSWNALKQEFKAGQREAEDPPTKKIPHRDVEPDPPDG